MKTQEETNQYLNISVDVLFHSIDELEKRIKQLERSIKNEPNNSKSSIH